MSKLNGQKIALLRKKLGLSQRELADQSKLTERTIRNAEEGKKLFPATIKAIAKTLGVEDHELRDEQPEPPRPPRRGSYPPYPALVVGRDNVLDDLRAWLGNRADRHESAEMPKVIQGGPGLGKSTVLSRLGWDDDVARSFRGGVLWMSLGQAPESDADFLISKMREWGLVLGDNLDGVRDPSVAEARLRNCLLSRERTLLLLDDVWKPVHVQRFNIGGPTHPLVVTTREVKVGNQYVKNLLRLQPLSPEDALFLLEELASEVVDNYREGCVELVRELEHLPLSIQVAGCMLNIEGARHGLSQLRNLISDLKTGRAILEQTPPPDIEAFLGQTTPTVATLLERSVGLLDPRERERFMTLGIFKEKPFTFDMAALASVWEEPNPKHSVDLLIDRGLLEPTGTGRYQIHSLLRAYAQLLLEREAPR